MRFPGPIMGAMNEQNLVPNDKRTPRERRENARKAGVASGEARRRKRTMRELVPEMLGCRADPRASSALAAVFPDIPEGERTFSAAIALKQLDKAVKGDLRAAQWLAEAQDAAAGRADAEEAAGRRACFDFATLLGPDFLALHRDLVSGVATDCWLPGGRGSMKSSTASLELARIVTEDPEAHALVCMANGVDIKDAAWAQVEWAMERLGVRGLWGGSPSSRKMVHRGTGQCVYFRGLNDPKKTKSIKPRFGRIKVAWFEECDQLRGGMGDVRTVLQSVTRGGDGFVRLYSFNPPRTRACWINEQVARVRAGGAEGERVYDSCYLNAPREWLGEQFFADADALRAADEESWRHEYLGEAVGYGANVFPRARVEAVPDSVRRTLEVFRYGVDWGFAADPFVWLKVGYDPASRTLYVLDEISGLGLSNAETAAMVAARMGSPRAGADGRAVEDAQPWAEVMCDSAEPKSIDEWRCLGIKADGAPKQGEFSVRSGVRWLQDRAAIVVDPSCEVAARELTGYEYARVEATGEITGRLPDRDNHAIDALRYACSTLIADRRLR